MLQFLDMTVCHSFSALFFHFWFCIVKEDNSWTGALILNFKRLITPSKLVSVKDFISLTEVSSKEVLHIKSGTSVSSTLLYSDLRAPVGNYLWLVHTIKKNWDYKKKQKKNNLFYKNLNWIVADPFSFSAGKYSWPISVQDFLLFTCLTC